MWRWWRRWWGWWRRLLVDCGRGQPPRGVRPAGRPRQRPGAVGPGTRPVRVSVRAGGVRGRRHSGGAGIEGRSIAGAAASAIARRDWRRRWQCGNGGDSDGAADSDGLLIVDESSTSWWCTSCRPIPSAPCRSGAWDPPCSRFLPRWRCPRTAAQWWCGNRRAVGCRCCSYDRRVWHIRACAMIKEKESHAGSRHLCTIS